MRSPEGIVVYRVGAPLKNACHSEEGCKPRRGNPHRLSGYLQGIATPLGPQACTERNRRGAAALSAE